MPNRSRPQAGSSSGVPLTPNKAPSPLLRLRSRGAHLGRSHSTSPAESSLPSKPAEVPLFLEALISVSSQSDASFLRTNNDGMSTTISLFRNVLLSDTFIYSTNPEHQVCDRIVLGLQKLQHVARLPQRTPKESSSLKLPFQIFL